MRRRAASLAAIGLAAGVLIAPAAVPSGVQAATSGQACTAENAAYAPETPAALTLLDSESVHQVATGAGIVVAVVDSGIDASNPHLTDAVIGGINLVGDGEREDGLSDLTGHGTAIAGQIAARPVSGSGVVGLAPEAQLLSVRVFRSDSDQDANAGFGPTAQRIADGIRYAADNGADIINVSLSQAADSPELREAVEHAAAVGSLVVASGGNRASDEGAENAARFPAAYPQALGVTATDVGGRATADSIHGPQVDIAAPGQNILTTAVGGGDCLFAAEAPASSYATGYASAAAALVAQAHPEDPPAGWAYRLTSTALRDDPDERTDENGWGFLQPKAAILLLPDPSTRGPVSPYFDTVGSAIRPAETTVVPDQSPSAFVLTREATVFIALGGATLLGVLGILIFLRRRKAERPTDPAETEQAGGLLDKHEPDAETGRVE